MRGCNLSSLSITLKAFRKESFNVIKISVCLLPYSRPGTMAVTLEFRLPIAPDLTSLCPSLMLLLNSHWEFSFKGRESLTFFAIKWPWGPWPSKTPQKVVFVFEPKFCETKRPFFSEAMDNHKITISNSKFPKGAIWRGFGRGSSKLWSRNGDDRAFPTHIQY